MLVTFSSGWSVCVLYTMEDDHFSFSLVSPTSLPQTSSPGPLKHFSILPEEEGEEEEEEEGDLPQISASFIEKGEGVFQSLLFPHQRD